MEAILFFHLLLQRAAAAVAHTRVGLRQGSLEAQAAAVQVIQVVQQEARGQEVKATTVEVAPTKQRTSTRAAAAVAREQ